MLKQKIYEKGKQILTVNDLKAAPSTLFVRLKYAIFGEFAIDNPVNNMFSCIGEDDLIQKWMENNLKNYDVWERIEKNRTPIFSEKIDKTLDDMFAEFAYAYTDSENYREEFMEDLLEELNCKFNITLKEEEDS